MYLSNVIMKTSDNKEKTQIIESISEGSVLAWSHVNLRGEYDFTRRASNEPVFDYKKIKSLKI